MGPTPKYEKQPQTIMLAPPCFTFFKVYCACIQWPLRPIRTILLSSVHRISHHFSLGQSMCSLANCHLFNTCGFFFSSGTLWRFLANSLASHKHLLITEVLTSKWRSFFISLELITGCFFAIIVILWSRRMVVFLFLPRVSGFLSHFKAFEIFLAEQPIIFCTSF